MIRETDAARDLRFTPMNDAVWGAGHWTRCAVCPPDAEGREVYHHVNAHR